MQQRPHGGGARGQDDFGRKSNQFGRLLADGVGVGGGPAGVDPHGAADAPARFCQLLQERPRPGLISRIVGSRGKERPDAPHPVTLLRARRERPCRCRAAEERDELAALHVWMAPAWQEIIWRAAQRSLAVMCPACWCSPGGLLALMGSANRVLIIQTGSMSPS